MAVKSIGDYVGVSADVVANFNGNQLVYFSWDHHLLIAAPFLICMPPDMVFGDMVRGPLAQLLSPDPDAALIDWDKVEWLKMNEPFTPDFNRSIAENGIRHKEQLRLKTPGLNWLNPAA